MWSGRKGLQQTVAVPFLARHGLGCDPLVVLTLTYFLLTVTDMEDGIRIREIRLEMSGKENFICCIAYQVTMM